MLAALIACVGLALLVTGVGLLSIPAALIVLGAALCGLGLLVDFDRRGGDA